MITEQLRVDTRGRTLTDLTAELMGFCASRGDGLAHAFCPHATAALVLIEMGAGSDRDLEGWLEEHQPRDRRYLHSHGSPGHGADHLLPALLGSHVSVPVKGGKPQLGTWQSLVLVDTNRDNNHRTVLLSFHSG